MYGLYIYNLLCSVEKDANVHILTGVLSNQDFVNVVQLISKSLRSKNTLLDTVKTKKM